MKVRLLEVDSRVFKGNVLAIQDFDAAQDFVAFERSYVSSYRPVYVSCKVPMERVTDTHVLEDIGFRLIEFQIQSVVKLRKPVDVSAYPYTFEPVTRQEDLREVLDIAAATFTHDRFSIDPLLDPGLSGLRYQEYVRQSIDAPDEAVYRLIEQSSGRTVAFKTHRYISNTEVLFLLGGVAPDLKNLGIGTINEYFEFNELLRKGVKRGTTHISAANYSVFNLEIGNLGFRVLTSFAVLRKVYR